MQSAKSKVRRAKMAKTHLFALCTLHFALTARLSGDHALETKGAGRSRRGFEPRAQENDHGRDMRSSSATFLQDAHGQGLLHGEDLCDLG